MSEKRSGSFGMISLERFLPAVAGDALKKRGFGEFKILTEWEKVVGPHLARFSTPIKMSFERGKNTNGALHVQVTSAMAPEFQHLEPIILERIATYFGYPAVGRLVLVQSHSAHISAKPKQSAPEAQNELLRGACSDDKLLSAIDACSDEELRASLLSLAQTVYSRQPKP